MHKHRHTYKHTYTDVSSVDVVLRIAIDVCSALKHLHACGIVHRDVAARNVLLSGTGSSLCCWFLLLFVVVVVEFVVVVVCWLLLQLLLYFAICCCLCCFSSVSVLCVLLDVVVCSFLSYPGCTHNMCR